MPRQVAAPYRVVMRWTLASCVLLVGCAGSGSLTGDPPDPTTSEEVSFTTSDGLTLHGTYQKAPGARRGPGLVLLHQFERDRHDFDPIWDELLATGTSLLSFDFRSHGQSDEASVPAVQLLSDRDQLPADVRAAIDFLQSERIIDVDPDRIGAVGLSVGGNLAIVANHRTWGSDQTPWGVQALATVSARLDRAQDLAGDDSLTLRDGLYVAGADEEIQAGQAVALEDVTGGDREVMLVNGSDAHGVELLEDAAVRARIAAWFGEVGL